MLASGRIDAVFKWLYLSTSEWHAVFRCLRPLSSVVISDPAVSRRRRSFGGARTTRERHVGGREEHQEVGAWTTQRYRLTGTYRSAARFTCVRRTCNIRIRNISESIYVRFRLQNLHIQRYRNTRSSDTVTLQ